ncbi:hypothetical protein [Mucilaginibacter sp. KACC 22063]|uniref:hypothetical protein n=1 Tax=Mucilaginibacter sp. KACC 22063 TaxID=3025666 RepID=UPI0023668FEB|nr:hypothetical protein [Mucilaginibacter sp. KACC 22063]WDF55776.1 hypothetical protein PQ461_01710 [Mucilaginibacter sp. KACC 22063]
MANILLIEPKYKNKYPPIGLMKIATYHRMLGDSVEFFKGDLSDLVLDKLTDQCLDQLSQIYADSGKKILHADTRNYIKTKRIEFIARMPLGDTEGQSVQIINLLDNYASIYRQKKHHLFPKWDRIYVTTLFTFYWKVTVEAIHYAKNLIIDQRQLFVGGVLASLLEKELEAETGIKSHPGLLDKPGMLDPENPLAKDLVIDNLPLDYSILDEIEYEYPTGSAYFTFMTKGCTRKCAFCSVPILEPTYKPKIETKDKFFDIKRMYGEQQNLLLMDNNVLASPNFPEIIQEIKDMGFYKGATFVEPNQYEIAIANLSGGINDRAYIRRTHKLLQQIKPRIKGANREKFTTVLEDFKLGDLESTTKQALLDSYEAISGIYEKYRPKSKKLRYVDFNQGTDARYVTDALMRLMSEIPIKPLRIAFDYWGMKDKYEKAVRLAGKYKIGELSNYILYNFKDTPVELYKRLEINVSLSEELQMPIYSFPMKYIPLFGEEAKTRDFIGSKWNKKFIRAIQSILNVTKGIVAPGRSFFERAFGKDLVAFEELLHMPEAYIIYRKVFEEIGLTQEWRELYNNINATERDLVKVIIQANDFTNIPQVLSEESRLLLSHYSIKREDAELYTKKDVSYKELKIQFDKLIKKDIFKNLTLTYDFEDEEISQKKIAV